MTNTNEWKYKPDVDVKEVENIPFDPKIDYVELMCKDLLKKKERGLTNIRLFGADFAEDKDGNIIQKNITPQMFAYSYCTMFDLL